MQSQASSIKWNSFFSFLSAFIRLCTNFILFVGIARVYGPEAFGQFTTAHSLSVIFLLLADFGFDTLLSTEIARNRNNALQVARKYFSLKIIFASFTTLVMLSLPLFHGFSSPTRTYIIIFSAYVLFSSLNNFFFALFKGFEQLHHETRISFITNVILLGVLLLQSFFSVSLFILAMLFVATKIIGLLLAIRVSTTIPLFQILKFDLTSWEEIRSRTLIFGFHYLFGSLFFTMDSMLLAFWKGDEEVGVYQSAFKIVVLVLVVPDIVNGAILPVLSRLYVTNKSRWMYLGQLANRTLLLVVLPIGMILFVYAEQIIHFIYGAGTFDAAVPLVRIFSVIIVVRFSVETFALMLTTSEQQLRRLSIVIFATTLNFCLNYFMIGPYGYLGAAIVSLATNIIVGLCYIYFTKEYFQEISWNSRSILSVITALIVGIVLWQVKSFSMWWCGPIAIAVYTTVSYYTGYSRDERLLVFSLNSELKNG